MGCRVKGSACLLKWVGRFVWVGKFVSIDFTMLQHVFSSFSIFLFHIHHLPTIYRNRRFAHYVEGLLVSVCKGLIWLFLFNKYCWRHPTPCKQSFILLAQITAPKPVVSLSRHCVASCPMLRKVGSYKTKLMMALAPLAEKLMYFKQT